MTTQRHKLTFLGERTYIQGPTLFDVLAQDLVGGEAICFKVNRQIRSDQIEVAGTLAGRDAKPDAEGTVATEGMSRNWYAWAVEMTAAPARQAYDETPLIEAARWGAQSISLSKQLDQSPCTTLVSLNKALLHRVLPQVRAGRWVFCEISFSNYPPTAIDFELRLKRSLAGGKLVASEFTVGGSSSGELLFTWGT